MWPSLMTLVSVIALLSPALAQSHDICIYYGSGGVNPGYDQLIAYYEGEFPDIDVCMTDAWTEALDSRLLILSLPGYQTPGSFLTFEEIILFAIQWGGDDKRLVIVGEGYPPFDPSGINGFLETIQTDVRLEGTFLDPGCSNQTSHINPAHPIMEGVTSVQYGDATSIAFYGQATELIRTADDLYTLCAVGPLMGMPPQLECGDVVALGSSTILSDACNALDHPGNRRLARNLYAGCAGPVPAPPATWGEIKALYH